MADFLPKCSVPNGRFPPATKILLQNFPHCGNIIMYTRFCVINFVESEGDDLKVDIQFEKFGHKRLMANYAGLEIID